MVSAPAGIWLSGTTNSIKFENLFFQNPAIVIKLGIKSDGTRNTVNGGVQNVQFINVQGSLNQVVSSGPAVDIGSDNYFIHFEKSAFQGNLALYSTAISTTSQTGFTQTVNTTAANNFATGMKCGLVQVSNAALNFSAGNLALGGITVVTSTQFTFGRPDSQSISGTGGYVVCDKGMNIVIDPGNGNGSGLLWFKEMQLNGGGIRLWSGNTNTVMYVDGLTLEGDFGHQTGPGVWVGSLGTNALVNVKNVYLADTVGNPIYNVVNDSYAQGGHVLYEGCVASPCTTGNGMGTGSGVHTEPMYYFNTSTAANCMEVADRAANFADSGVPCFQQGQLPLAYDNFNRANGSTGANWTQITLGGNAGTPTIAANKMSATATATSLVWDQAYIGNPNPPNSTISANQWSEVTVTGLNGGGTARVGAGVRRTATTAFGTGYVCYENDTTAQIEKISGAETNLVSTAVSGVAGDVIRCEASGSTITMYRNGASILSTTDATFATGQPSVYMFTSGCCGVFTISADNWSGGSLPGGFATLDAEQSFSQAQHFHSMTIGAASPAVAAGGPLANDTLYLNSNPLNSVSGNSGRIAQSLGTLVVGNLTKTDANGNIVDSGISAISGATSLSGLTAASAANAINNVDNAQTWNWALTTAAKAGMKFTENTAATAGAGSQFIVQIATLLGSTAVPLNVANLLSGSQALPAVSITPTWNTSALATAMLVNVTSTASAAGSLLADFQVAGASQFKIDKSGNATVLTSVLTPSLVLNGRTLSSAGGNAAAVTTQSATLTNGKVLVGDANNNASPAGGAGTLGITFPGKLVITGALCNNATASPAFNLPTSSAPTANCNTGTNVQEATLDFADAQSAQYSVPLPSDWTGAIDARVTFFDSSTSGTVIWNIATACTATNGSAADDTAFNTADAFGTVTVGSPTSEVWEATKTGITTTGCSAGNKLAVKISRATDTAAGVARLSALELTVRRAL